MFNFSSSLAVNAALWLLILFSIVTWSIITIKIIALWKRGVENKKYSAQFWNAASLTQAIKIKSECPMSHITQEGIKFLQQDCSDSTTKNLFHAGSKQDILERCLRLEIQKERHELERGLTVLASVGSTAPFIGLFGTVLGIMHALQEITAKHSASVDAVAGPVGETLIATAIGIAAAIPAVLAYNFFLRKVKLCEAELENFANDFLRLIIQADFKLGNGDTDGI
jgi:biopolymer transport protein ExbB